MKQGDFQATLMSWEQQIVHCEAMGTEFDPTLKKAVILKRAPQPVATYMCVTLGAAHTYTTMHAAIEAYYRNLGQWHLGDVVDDD